MRVKQKQCRKCGKVFDNIKGTLCTKCVSKERRAKLKQKAVEYKGGKCSVCGYDKNLTALEFHHTNPNAKDFTPSQMSSFSWDKVQEELDKCELVCSNCHREKHEKVSLEQYENAFLNKNKTDNCLICNKVKTSKQDVGSLCNNCRKVYYHRKFKQKVVKCKGDKCSICGYDKCLSALEFHHVNEITKNFNICSDYHNWEETLEELNKCILICANCHREIHNK